MIVRSGKIYSYKQLKKRKRKTYPIINNSYSNICINCSICYKNYTKGELIASCSDRNFYKHNYHEKCLKTYFKVIGTNYNCPYCRAKINNYSIMQK